MIIFKNLPLSTLLLTILALFSLSACATVDGVGKDIESVGDSIQD